MRLRAAILLVLAAGALFCAAGCSTTDADGRPQESNIPWNRPQSWEGPGVYGSAINEAH